MNILNKERIYFRNIKEINRICSILNLSNFVCLETKRLYKYLVWNNLTQGILLEKLIASIVYFISRRDNLNIKMKSICKLLDLDFYSTFRTYKKIKKKLKNL